MFGLDGVRAELGLQDVRPPFLVHHSIGGHDIGCELVLGGSRVFSGGKDEYLAISLSG